MNDSFKNQLNKTEKISINSTFEFIKDFSSQKKFEIVSKYPTINGTEVTIKLEKDIFTFLSEGFNLVSDMVKYQNKGFGYTDKFLLKSKDCLLEVPLGVKSMKIAYSEKGEEISGEISFIRKFNEDFTKNTNYYFRYITPIKYVPGSMIGDLFQTVLYNDGKRIYRSLFSCRIEEINFKIFQFNQGEDDFYLVIDCSEQIKKELFENFVEKIIFSFGFISGCLHRNNYQLFGYLDHFETVDFFQFEEIKKSVISSISVIHPEYLSSYYNSKNTIGFMNKLVFEKLVSESFNNQNFFRALQLICESSLYSGLIRSSVLSVALETLKNVIIDRNKKSTPPIKRKQISKILINKLKRIVDEIDKEEFNDKSIILKKIENINQTTNTDSFFLMFEILGLRLNKFYQDILKSRNDFLHGKIPNEVRDGNINLETTSLKLRFLISVAILKYCGYNGYVLNYSELKALHLGLTSEKKESLFIYI